MTLTPDYLTGFETGIVSLSGGGGTGGGGLADILVGNFTVINSDKRSGTYCAQATPTTTVAGRWGHVGITASRRAVSRFAIKVVALPDAGLYTNVHEYYMTTATTVLATIRINETGDLSALFTGGSEQIGPNINDGNWHVIETNCDVGASPWTMDWKVNGVAQTQVTLVHTADTVKRFYLGTGQATGGGAATILFDDFICGYSTAGTPTEWFGNGEVLAYVPTADGTHQPGTVDFVKGYNNLTTYIVGGATPTTDAYTLVDDALWSTTRDANDNIAQKNLNTTEYVEVKIASSTISHSGSANAVDAKLAYASSGTSANEMGCQAYNSANVASEIHGNPTTRADYSESSNFFKHKIVTPPGAGWTATEVNAIYWRMGWSNDTTPYPSVQALKLEVDWPLPFDLSLAATGGGASAAGSNVVLTVTLVASVGNATASGPSVTIIFWGIPGASGGATADGGTVSYSEVAQDLYLTAAADAISSAASGGTALYYKGVVVIADPEGQTQATADGTEVDVTISTVFDSGEAMAGGGTVTYTAGLALTATNGDAVAAGGTATSTNIYSFTANNGGAIAGGGIGTFTKIYPFTASNGDAIAAGGTATFIKIYPFTASNGGAVAMGGTATSTNIYSFTASNGASTANGGAVTLSETFLATVGTVTAGGGTVNYNAGSPPLNLTANSTGQILATASGTTSAFGFTLVTSTGSATAVGDTVIFARAYVFTAIEGNATAGGGTVTGLFGKFPSTKPGPDYLTLDPGKINELGLDENHNAFLALSVRSTSPGLTIRTTSPGFVVRITHLTLSVNHLTGVILDENHTGYLTLSARETSPGLNAPDKELILDG